MALEDLLNEIQLNSTKDRLFAKPCSLVLLWHVSHAVANGGNYVGHVVWIVSSMSAVLKDFERTAQACSKRNGVRLDILGHVSPGFITEIRV